MGKNVINKNYKAGAISTIILLIFIFSILTINPKIVKATGEDEIILDFSFQQPTLIEVTLSNITYHKISMNGTISIEEFNLPKIPVKPLKILLPQKREVVCINITYEGNTSLQGEYNLLLGNESLNISAYQNDSNKPEFEHDKPYPSELASNYGIYSIRGYSILAFNLHPVHYIQDTGEIYYYENMTVNITTEETGSANPLFRNLTKDEEIVKELVDDYSKIYTYDSPPSIVENSTIVNSSKKYDFVIVTTKELWNANPFPLCTRNWYTFKDLADNKTSQGIKTKIINISDIKNDPFYWNRTNQDFNDTQAILRRFLFHAFQLWHIDYVLLGGDNSSKKGGEIVPARNLWFMDRSKMGFPEATMPSDVYYACLEGNFNYDEDGFWGEPTDGGPSGDLDEPRVHEGIYYAEADSADFESSFGVGLFTPVLNLSGESDVNITCYVDRYSKSGIYCNISTFSGGTNTSTSKFEKVLWSNGNDGKAELSFDPTNYTDPENVYIQFNYTDTCDSLGHSFNIDKISCWINNEQILSENFEGDQFPPEGWTQVQYFGTGLWTQEYYKVDVDLGPELYVGRAPAGNSVEVSNFVKKTLDYEKTPSHSPYLENVLLIGSLMDKIGTFGGNYTDQLIDYNDSDGLITEGIPSDKYEINKLYDREENFNILGDTYNYWPKFKLINKLNDKDNYIHICCIKSHGYTNSLVRSIYPNEGDLAQWLINKLNWLMNWIPIYSEINSIPRKRLSVNDVCLLKNNNYFFVHDSSCLCGAFDNYFRYPRPLSNKPEGIYPKEDCLAEYLTVKSKHGAFAVIMNSRYGIYTPRGTSGESQILTRLFFNATYNKGDYQIGKAHHNSKAEVIDQIITDLGDLQTMRMVYYSLNLFGDPTVSIKLPDEYNDNPSSPETPEIHSQNGKSFTFSTITTDPEGDQISYKWKWDSHECLFWTKYYNSGDDAFRILYLPSGSHEIRVKSRDIFGNESDWSDPLSVEVSFNLDMDVFSSPVVLGEEVQFYGQTSGGASLPVMDWNYSFGDGNFSDEQNSNHTYESIGTYCVNLTVKDSQNITSNVTKVVDVVILKSDINCSSENGIPNETISFNDFSDGYYNISSWNWDFGDGNTSSNRNTSHAYASEGVYNVTLNVTDDESNYNVSYQTIGIDTSDPEIAAFSSNINEVGYGYDITISANLTDNISGIKIATVNISYPNDIYGNFTMNNTEENTYEYVFNDTSQLGEYSYKVWVVDNAENLESSSQKDFTVIRSFGYRNVGDSNQSIWDIITGSKYKVNLKGVADNMSVYLDPGNATSDYHYQCAIYRHNDSKLMGISEEKNISSGKGWKTFNFSVPKPVLINDTEYVLCCWSDNYTVKMYYDDSNEEEEYYNDGSSTLQGHYFEGVYNYTPEINNFEHEGRRYTIYCKFTPDNSSPMIANVSDIPDTVGFGFNITFSANVTDNASGIAIVKVNVTYPDNTHKNYILNNTKNSTYEYVFSNTWLVGEYSYSIWASDYAGNSISNSGHSFNVSAQATVSIATLKNNYGASEYINITDPPTPPDDYYLVDRGLTWNEYYNASSGKNIREIYTNPINYQYENGNWLPIETDISLLDSEQPAYNYGYRTGNEHGLYNVYFKPNAKDNWPVAFAYNKSTTPNIQAVRSKLVGVGYLDPSQNWAYEFLQNIQSSQGQISGNSAIYENVLTGTDVIWSYGNNGLKEEIIMGSTAKSALQEHPPSDYGLSDQDSYLVFITKLDYQNLNLYNSSGLLTGNFTMSNGQIDFKDALGELKCALPVGEAYEMNNISSRQELTYRIIQYNGNYYLLSGLKVSDLNEMTFPVVIDPTLTVYSSNYDGEINSDSSSYSTAHDASEGLPYDYYPFITIGQKSETGGPPRCFIWRGFTYFDTSSIPSNDLIDSVTLSLYKEYDYSTTDFDIVIQNGQPTYPHSYLVPGDYNKNHYSGNGGYINTASFSNGYNNITLTNFSWINTSGTTKLCIRSSRDINSNTPTGNEYITVYSSEYPTGGSPKLVIEYRNQSKINNSGSTDIKGYLLIRVEYLNASSDWANDCVAIDDTAPRVINSSEELALDLIFNGLVNTDDLTHGDGTYRVYAAFRDPEGNILQTNDEKDMVSWYEVQVEK